MAVVYHIQTSIKTLFMECISRGDYAAEIPLPYTGVSLAK